VDRVRRVVHRCGRRVDFSAPYLDALLLLIDSRPHVVRKDELQAALQLSEPSMTKAVELIRKALGDVGKTRRLIVTERGEGYRFIAEETTEPAQGRAKRRRKPWLLPAIVMVALFVTSLVLWTRRPPLPPDARPIAVVRADNAILPVVTDGAMLYFGVWDNSRFSIQRVSLAEGQPHPLPTHIPNPEICDISHDGKLLLVRAIPTGGVRIAAAPLWIMRTNGDAVGSVGNVSVVDATWTPDDRGITFSRGPDLFMARPDGTGIAKLATVDAGPGALLWWLRWAPDGKRLRFTVTKGGILGRTMWEFVVGDKGAPHELSGMDRFTDVCCGAWTDKHYVFSATPRESATTQIWTRNEAHNAPSAPAVLLANDRIDYRGPVPSPNNTKLFICAIVPRGEIVRQDRDGWSSLLRVVLAGMIDFSRDGRRIAYITIPERALWIANADGTDSHQLAAGLFAAMPRWSPDGKRVAFMGHSPWQPWRAYTIDITDGSSRPLLATDDGQQADPTWSLHGDQILVARSDARGSILEKVDVETGSVFPVTASSGLDSPRWSPDGRAIAAFSSKDRTLMMYDLAKDQWTPLTAPNPTNSGYPCWSRDGKTIYFLSTDTTTGAGESIVMKLDVKSRKLIRAATLARVRQGAGTFGSWIGLDDKDILLSVKDFTTQGIDVLEWPH
jgi:DNA-binding winged helix-turn-helix (wHTH) protein